jgi:hypothetical protein
MQLEVFFFVLSTATTITPTKADPKIEEEKTVSLITATNSSK